MTLKYNNRKIAGYREGGLNFRFPRGLMAFGSDEEVSDGDEQEEDTHRGSAGADPKRESERGMDPIEEAMLFPSKRKSVHARNAPLNPKNSFSGGVPNHGHSYSDLL